MLYCLGDTFIEEIYKIFLDKWVSERNLSESMLFYKTLRTRQNLSYIITNYFYHVAFSYNYTVKIKKM